MGSKIGEWAFIIGILLAVIFAFFSAGDKKGLLVLVLVIVGLIAGLLNISEKETTPFLVAAVALMVTSTADLAAIDTLISNVGTWLNAIVANIAIMVAPAAIVVAVKAIYSLAKD